MFAINHKWHLYPATILSRHGMLRALGGAQAWQAERAKWGRKASDLIYLIALWVDFG